MRIMLSCIFCWLCITGAFASGFDIKTSSVIAQPNVEVLGDLKGSWYAIGFEKPGNLNKPPRYQIFKFATGFKTGKTSILYSSFGEKTLYLRSAFVNNKIAMFYAMCGKREDVNALLDKREGHQQLPILMRQDYDATTLEPVGEPVMIFNEEEDFFSPSGIEIVESSDKTKVAVLVKCYYKQQKYKVIITDNNTGEMFSKIYDFKLLKEYLKFLKVKVSNTGQVIIETKVRDDVITLNTSTANKNQVKYYFFSITNNEEKPKQIDFTSPVGRDRYFTEPSLTMLNNNDVLISYDFFSTETDHALKGTSVFKYDADFNAIGKTDIVPDSKFIPQAAAYHTFKNGKEFTHLETKQILLLADKGFVLVTEYHDTLTNADKTKASVVERNYLITTRVDENLRLKAQHFIAKKQNSALVDYAFSTQGYVKANDVYLFHNDDWETDEEHNMNLQCTRLAADGSEPITQKIVNTSNDFFSSMEHLFMNADGKLLFTEEKLVEYKDVSREIKLLEISLK